MSPLATLIERVRQQAADDGNPLSYAKIADRGSDLTRGEVQRYATKPLRGMLTLEKRRSLALGLRVHPVEVDTAIAQALDLWLAPSDYDYRTDPDLTPRDRREINDFIEWIKRGRAHG